MKLLPARARHALILAAFLVAQAAPEAAPRQASTDGHFSHTDHVRRGWLNARLGKGSSPEDSELEFARDCRGCHDYSNPDPAQRLPPSAHCKNCHAYQRPSFLGTSVVDPSAEAGGKGRSSGSERFNHNEHWGLACYECHLPEGTKTVPSSMKMDSLGSAAACGECHGPGGSAQDKRAQFDAGINARLARRGAADFGDFRHDQHIRAEDLQSRKAAVCKDCHVEVQDATAQNLGDKQFTVELCAKCHEGVEFKLKTFQKDSRTAGTFLHSKHLSPAALASDAALGERGCYACHAYDKERDVFDLGERFPKGAAYQGCIGCHQHESWKVPSHGAVDECRKCHDLDGGALGQFVEIWRRRQAKTDVLRPPPASFQIGSQAHPFLAGAERVDEGCKPCHVARIPGFPSRLSGLEFSHATHLSKDPSEHHQECRACHTSLSAAAGPAEIVFPPSVGKGAPLYELAHCQSCHNSKDLEAVASGTPESRRVLRFSHQEHLSKKHPLTKQPLACTDCHVPSGARVELKPSVDQCTECHGHVEKSEPTKRHTRQEVESCAECHQIGVPSRQEPVPVERLALASISGKRTHPRAASLPGGGDCVECHELRAPEGKPAAREHTYRMTWKHKNPHDSPGASGDQYFAKHVVGARTTWCIDCHWGSFENKSVTAQQELIKRQKWYRSEEYEWRSEQGPLLAPGYPEVSPPP